MAMQAVPRTGARLHSARRGTAPAEVDDDLPPTIAATDDDVDLATADAMQAAYFREALAEERGRIAERFARHGMELARRSEVGMMSGTAHLQSQVRSLEAELRYLEDLIAKIDRRFTPSLAATQDFLIG